MCSNPQHIFFQMLSLRFRLSGWSLCSFIAGTNHASHPDGNHISASFKLASEENVKLFSHFCLYYVLDYGMDDRRFESRWGLGIFLFTTASRPARGHTHPPIQWVPGAVSLGVKRMGREADHSPPSSAEVKE
jgi:hypothetical protein